MNKEPSVIVSIICILASVGFFAFVIAVITCRAKKSKPENQLTPEEKQFIEEYHQAMKD